MGRNPPCPCAGAIISYHYQDDVHMGGAIMIELHVLAGRGIGIDIGIGIGVGIGLL